MKLEWREETFGKYPDYIIRDVATRSDGHVKCVITRVRPGTFDYSEGIRYTYRVASLDVYGRWGYNSAETRYYKRLAPAKRYAQRDADESLAYYARLGN